MSTSPSPRRRRRPQGDPGTTYHSDEFGGLVRLNDQGEEEPWAPRPTVPKPISTAGPRPNRRPTSPAAPSTGATRLVVYRSDHASPERSRRAGTNRA